MMVIKIRRLPSGLGYDVASAVRPISGCAVARLAGVAVWDCPLGAGTEAALWGKQQPVLVQLQAGAAFLCSKGKSHGLAWVWAGRGGLSAAAGTQCVKNKLSK